MMKPAFRFVITFYVVAVCLSLPNIVIATQSIGYVVGKNKKIYEVDLNSGSLIRQSKPLENVGGIANIAISPTGRTLYVASDRSVSGTAFAPILVINIGNDNFEQIDEFHIEPRFDLNRDPLRKNPLQNMAYRVAVSPDGTELFVLDAAGTENKLTAVIDAQTGKLKYRTKFGVALVDLVSPDNQLLVEMWPKGTVKRNGKLKHFKAGIAVSDIKQSRLLSKTWLNENRGFQPPWAKLSSPFVYLRSTDKRLLAFNRDTGQQLANIDLKQLTECGPDNRFAKLPDASHQITLVTRCSESKDAIIILDLINSQVTQKIEMAPLSSNIVVTTNSPQSSG